MRVAIVGYGRMGREVESVLRERGHEPVPADISDPFPADCSTGIDFTEPSAVPANVRAALAAKCRYVVGTTGWSAHFASIAAAVEEAGGGLVYAPNFSLGVNLFYRVVRQAAELLSPFPEYDPYIVEKHHRMKKDAPSGTARTLSGLLETAYAPRRPVEVLDGALPADGFHVAAVRAGGIIGDHLVGFDSGGDEILLEHRARSRRGLALGAVLAAEWIATRRGVHSFEAVLDDLLKGR